MKKLKLTCAHAIVKHLTAQKILIDGKKQPLFPGVFGIFGHGNVACLGQALEENKDKLPTYRGHHEQNMALTGVAYSRAKRRKQIFIATSSVGPGSTNLLTAAAVAMSNRIPILFLPGDTYANRMPDPVLQQVEHFNNPGITANDAFKSVTRYFDRITRPEQILQSLPQAIQLMIDPADAGPACLSLCQDIQGETFDYPEEFFKERVHNIRRPKPDDFEIKKAAEKIKSCKNPIIISGGGVFYSDATIDTGKHYILNTLCMDGSTLNYYGLQLNDTQEASDHLPLIFDISIDGNLDLKEKHIFPKQSMLDHSFPNPFNVKIQITLSLLSFSIFELSIIDLKGTKVNTLYKGKKSKGVYQFAWDGRDGKGNYVVSGIYFVLFQTESNTESQKIILLK